MNETLLSIAKSWRAEESPLNGTAELLDWVRARNAETAVQIKRNRLSDSGFWFYDREEGRIRNRGRSFFSVAGFTHRLEDGRPLAHPVLIQEEIGFLGVLCREFDGVMHFLMQAKIEPGNVNQVQISPTLQATRSNFTQKHGGARPPYLDYFTGAARYELVADQLQSEQSSRFYKKRNRNMMVRVREEVPLLPSHRWMTLGQLKRLMREPNLVNMDTRTVFSCVPFSRLALPEEEREALSALFRDQFLFRSAFTPGEDRLVQLFQRINDYKMFTDAAPRFVPLHELEGWDMDDWEISCREPFPFRVIFADVAIEGREVARWTQPLFEAAGIAEFGLICFRKGDRTLFLPRLAPESGCFDSVELGPTVQREASSFRRSGDAVTRLFFQRLEEGRGVLFDQLLSEEGGRFYHEQNRNVLLEVPYEDLPPLPPEYFPLDFRTLNELVQFPHMLNIQLRNLLSLLEG